MFPPRPKTGQGAVALRAGRARASRWVLWSSCAALSGCVAGPLDISALEREYSALAAVSQHHLGDVTPYLLPSGGQLAFFLCRWPTDEPIPVSLPPDADPDERKGLEAVMRAWESAGLDIRFGGNAPPGHGIEVRFIEPQAEATQSVYAANTVTDCAVAPGAFDAPKGAAIPAKLVFASILIWRGGFDNIGRPVRHSRGEFLGSALHEFGHALGFQGHVKVGESVMGVDKDLIRRAGEHLDRGTPFRDSTLRALYSVPSGSVIHRAMVPEVRTRAVDRLARIAALRGWASPFVRVGDVDGFLVWQDGSGIAYRLRIPGVRRLLHAPAEFQVRTPPEVLELLEANPPSDRSDGPG